MVLGYSEESLAFLFLTAAFMCDSLSLFVQWGCIRSLVKLPWKSNYFEVCVTPYHETYDNPKTPAEFASFMIPVGIDTTFALLATFLAVVLLLCRKYKMVWMRVTLYQYSIAACALLAIVLRIASLILLASKGRLIRNRNTNVDWFPLGKLVRKAEKMGLLELTAGTGIYLTVPAICCHAVGTLLGHFSLRDEDSDEQVPIAAQADNQDFLPHVF